MFYISWSLTSRSTEQIQTADLALCCLYLTVPVGGLTVLLSPDRSVEWEESKDDDDEILKSAGCVMETVRPAASHYKKSKQTVHSPVFLLSLRSVISEVQMLFLVDKLSVC